MNGTRMKIKKQTRQKLPFIGAAAAILALASGAAYYVISSNNSPNYQDITESPGVNYNPPTPEEVTSSQDGKKQDAIAEPDDSPPPSKSDKKTVNVGISFADMYGGQLEIRAFANNVPTGEDGTCTATAKLGSKVVTKSSAAFDNGSSYQCKPIYIPAAKLESGTWSVTVTFSSAKSEGTSETVRVNVP